MIYSIDFRFETSGSDPNKLQFNVKYLLFRLKPVSIELITFFDFQLKKWKKPSMLQPHFRTGLTTWRILSIIKVR